jgi:hypothetical protein
MFLDRVPTQDMMVANKGYVDSVAPTIYNRTATLTVGGWSSLTQTVSVSNITGTNTVFAAAAPASTDAYSKAGIKCTTQGTNVLTFTCKQVPTADITVNIVVMEV